MQKAASTERKGILKKQRNLIRQQLSTKNMLTNIKVNTPRERRMSGPLKVIQSHTESIRSETSVSKRNSSDGEREVLSITSHHSHSVVSRLSELSGSEMSSKTNKSDSAEKHNAIKRTLLMRQTALEKRKKAAEDLLQWHKRLLEEEKRIIELESTATAIICQKPDKAFNESQKHIFTGKQLNQLWYNLTGIRKGKFLDDKTYPMSQIALERFCKSAREYSLKPKEIIRKISDSDKSESRIDAVVSETTIPKDILPHQHINGDISEHIATASEYGSDFEVESIQECASENIDIVDQSIHQLIDNFSKIKDDIATLSLKRSKSSEYLKNNFDYANKFEKSDSEEEISVIETNKTSNISRDKSEDIVSSIITREDDIKQLQDLNSNLTQIEVSEEKNDIVPSTSNENIPSLSVPTIEDRVKSATRDIVSKQLQVLDNLSEALIFTESDKIPDIETDKVLTHIPHYPQSTIESYSVPSEQAEITPDITQRQQPDSNRDTVKVNIESVALEVPSDMQLSTPELPTGKGGEKIPSSEKINSYSIINTCDEYSNISSEKDHGKNSRKESSFGAQILQSVPQSQINSHDASVFDNHSIESIQKDEEPLCLASEQVEVQMKTPMSSNISTENQLNSSEIIAEDVGGVVNSDQPSIAHQDVNNGLSEELMEEHIKSSIIQEFTDIVEIKENHVSELCQENIGETESLIESDDRLLETDYVAEKNHRESQIFSDKILKHSSEIVEYNSSILNNEVDKSGLKNNLPKPSMENKITNNLREISMEEKSSAMESILPNSNDDSLKETDIDEELSTDDIEESGAIEKEIQLSSQQCETVEVESTMPPKSSSDKSSPKELLNSCEDKEQDSLAPETSESLSSRQVVSEKSDNLDRNSCENKEQDSLAAITSESLSSSQVVSGKSDNLDRNSCENEEQDSLSPIISESLSSSQVVSGKPDNLDREKSVTSSEKLKSTDKSPKNTNVDVKKRISEIMADTNVSRGDKNSRLQDLYVTTYDLVSPVNSPPGSPAGGQMAAPTIMFNNEAEEILRKQLAIEQEIKQITEQQQKEQLPFMFVREIPNKPPPPYTPPSPSSSITATTIIPSVDEIEEITKYSSKILYKAYLTNNLQNINISDNTLKLICKNITKSCYKFVFDLCKEMCKEHYKQFAVEDCAPWLQVRKRTQLASVQPLDSSGLEKYMCRKLKELFAYEKPVRRENTIIKWSRKKRDHVDEILVMESQAEEAQWINYDKDELIVKDQVTNEIMNMLLKETGQILNNIFKK